MAQEVRQSFDAAERWETKKEKLIWSPDFVPDFFGHFFNIFFVISDIFLVMVPLFAFSFVVRTANKINTSIIPIITINSIFNFSSLFLYGVRRAFTIPLK
jgi:hypothetical protein